MNKTEILILCMIILSVLAIVCSFVFREKKEDMFIIENGYNGEVHYINENKRNNTKVIIIELENKKGF